MAVRLRGVYVSRSDREAKADLGTPVQLALDDQLATVRFYQVLDDGQAEAGPAQLPGSCLIRSVEALRDPGQILGRDADAGVGHRDFDNLVLWLTVDG